MSQEQEALDAIKQRCVEGETAEEHDTHAAELAAAYAAFQLAGGETRPSHPAVPGTAQVQADVVVDSSTGPA